jgi:HAD superfamily hydrolase (TIGR01509 family)
MWRPEAIPDALLVDLDGTLADSHPVLWATFEGFLRARGITATQAAFDSLDGARLTEIVVTLRERHGLAEPVERLVRDYQLGLENAYRMIEAAPGAYELVGAARAAGTRLVLVTSAPRALAAAFLAGAGLADAFAGIVSGEDGPVKPDPAPYRAALRLAGAEPGRALVVEDAPAGVRAAGAAGLAVVGVAASAERADALRAAGAEHIVADLHELAGALVAAAAASAEAER